MVDECPEETGRRAGRQMVDGADRWRTRTHLNEHGRRRSNSLAGRYGAGHATYREAPARTCNN